MKINIERLKFLHELGVDLWQLEFPRAQARAIVCGADDGCKRLYDKNGKWAESANPSINKKDL